MNGVEFANQLKGTFIYVYIMNTKEVTQIKINIMSVISLCADQLDDSMMPRKEKKYMTTIRHLNQLFDHSKTNCQKKKKLILRLSQSPTHPAN